MKILLTSDWYRPAVNGVVTSVLNLRAGLEAMGHEVRILTLSQSVRSREEDGVSCIGSLPAGLIYPGARLRSALAGKQIHALLRWAPDVIHSQCEFSTFFLARKLSESLDVPLVHTYHTVYEDYTHYFSPSVRLGRQAVAMFTRWIAARSDCLIAPTDKVRKLLEGYHVSAPIAVIPTGIQLERFRQPTDPARQTALRQQLGLSAEEPVLVSVGRLAEEKNIDELIHCAAALSVTLLLVGDGPYRSHLEELARRSGARVIFAGMAAPETVADYYRLGDLFVSASSSETQGLTYIEALASGTPALCRADPCLDGVIADGVNGWQYRDRTDFLEKAAYALTHPIPAEQVSASVERYSVPNFAQAVEAVYRNAIDWRQAAPGVSA